GDVGGRPPPRNRDIAAARDRHLAEADLRFFFPRDYPLGYPSVEGVCHAGFVWDVKLPDLYKGAVFAASEHPPLGSAARARTDICYARRAGAVRLVLCAAVKFHSNLRCALNGVASGTSSPLKRGAVD